jgi:phosphopantetheine adenylyltransferase
MRVKITDVSGLERDIRSMAVININKDALVAAKRKQENQKKYQDRLDHLENDIKEIKNLLHKLLEK